MNKNAFKFFLLLLAIMTSLMPLRLMAETDTAINIKADFIYNFAVFTQWKDDSEELKICVLGNESSASYVYGLHGKILKNRIIKVVREQNDEDLKNCQIALLNYSLLQINRINQVLKKIKGENVLTTTELEDVIELGVMISMISSNNRITFKVNNSAAKASKLDINAHLLKLAIKVI